MSAGDSTPSLYFRNRCNGTFREDTALRGIALSEDGEGNPHDVTLRPGLGVEDLDNNGLPDLFVVTGSVYPGEPDACWRFAKGSGSF